MPRFIVCGKRWAAFGGILCITWKTWRIGNGRGIKIGSDKIVLRGHRSLGYCIVGNLPCLRDTYRHTRSNIDNNDSVNGCRIRIFTLISKCIGKEGVVYRDLKGPYRICRNLHLQAKGKDKRAWRSITVPFKQIGYGAWQF